MFRHAVALVFTALILMVSLPCYGLEWATAYRAKGWDVFRSVQQTSDGGYVVAGETNSFRDGYSEFWILKLDADGAVVWDRVLGGALSAEDAKAWSVLQASDGGYVVAGKIQDITTDSIDALVVKLDSNGVIEWEKKYGGEALDIVRSVDQTTDGGYIVGGNAKNSDVTHHDYWLLKLNANGTVAWQNTYGTTEPELGYSVRQTTDGGYIMAGYTEPDPFDFQNADGWVVKLYPDNQPNAGDQGAVEWQRTYDHHAGDQIFSITQTTDGGFIMTGITNSLYRNSPDDDLWVVKLFSDGTIDWERSYGGNGADIGWDVKETADGGYVVAGATATRCFSVGCTDFWLLKLSATGTVVWEKTYGGNFCDYAYAVQQTADGGFIVAGDSASFGSYNNGHEPLVLKLDANGDIPGCTAMGVSYATVTDTASTVQTTAVAPVAMSFSSVDMNLAYAVGTAAPSDVCATPYIDEILPAFSSGRRFAGKTVDLIGDNFGSAQGSSVVHINGKLIDITSPRMRIWTNKFIRVKTPNYDCSKFNERDFIKRKVWLTIDGVDSNVMKLKLTKPESCP